MIICIWSIYLRGHVKKWSNISTTKWWNFSYIAKINNFNGFAWFIDEYIFRFNVPMHKAFIMNIFQSQKYLLYDISSFILTYSCFNIIFQPSASTLKNHHNLIWSLLMIEQLNNIRMLKLIQNYYLILNSWILLFIWFLRNHLFMNRL